MEIQNIYKCKKYKPNDNLNKTCDNKARCKIYYGEVCKEYKDETCNNNSISDYNDSNGDFYSMFE